MMYFEDYMEMIEGLPQEVLEKLTQMRQSDLALDNTLQPLGARIAELFARCSSDAAAASAEWGQSEHADICAEFAKARCHSDEKLALARQLLDTVGRLKRRLGTELEKFKLELEADHAGVTSSIEERLLREEDLQHQQLHQSQEHHHFMAVTNGHAVDDAALASLAPESPAAAAPVTAASSATGGHHRRPHSPLSSVGSSYGDVGGMATPRRGGGSAGGLKRNRTSFFSGLEHALSDFDQQAAAAAASVGVGGGASSDSLVAAFLSDVGLDATAAGSGLYAEDNQRYCVCHDVSHGEMIACENAACPFEWFHFACVGLTVAPKGSWYCPRCKAAGVKRQRLK